MKKIIILLFALITLNYANAQGCLPYAFNSQLEIDNFQTNFPGCTVIEGSVTISGADIVNLYGLNVVTKFHGTLTIGLNPQLTNLGGLELVDTVSNSLIITGNSSLESLGGLESLSYIGNDLKIGSNPNLTSILAGGQLDRVAVELMISNNEQLTSLSGFESLQSVGALTIMGNSQLTSLAGIEYIDGPAMAWVTIMSNPNLSTCDVQSICDFLSSQAGPAQIWDNAPGCNDEEEVEEACLVGIQNIFQSKDLSISPNPANQIITITAKNKAIIQQVKIYNQTGQQVYRGVPENNTLDISKLRPGMYVVEVISDNGSVRKKLIVNH